jgi:hypothetical protein
MRITETSAQYVTVVLFAGSTSNIRVNLVLIKLDLHHCFADALEY